MTLLDRVGVVLKAATMRWGSGVRSWWGVTLGRTRIDYASQAGDGRGNSIVVACLNWIGRTLPEAPVQVVRVKRDGSEEVVRDHPLARLLQRPNPYYSGAVLLQATASDFKATGNAYWLKGRAQAGNMLELWWVPSSLMEPRWPEGDDGRTFISHYEYSPGGVPVRYRPEDVVHFRNGIDPTNPRKGLSEIAALVREVVTDDEAANYTASLLRNMATPSVVIAPDSDDTVVTKDDAEQIKQDFSSRFGGDNRGAPLVMSARVKVTPLSFPPSQMDLSALRAIPEGRISAVLGVHAAVTGLPMGLANTKVGATMSEMREESYENCIIPLQRVFAAEMTAQLLPDLGDPRTERVEFDISQVRVLQPDLDKLYTRLDTAVRGGWMTPNEARQAVDLDPLPDGDVIYLPSSLTPTDPTSLIPPEPEPAEALPPPEPLRALPAPAKRGTKGAHAPAFAERMRRLTARHAPALERAVLAGLERERDAVLARLGLKDTRPIPDPTAWLGVLLQDYYRRALQAVVAAAEDALDAPIVLPQQHVQAYLAEAGANIAGITETTRAAVAEALQAGQAIGEGVPQLAARIRELGAFGQARAETIARTELGQAVNRATVVAFRASGLVVGVQVLDGHDDEPCASLNGRRLTLEQAERLPPLGHPNCTRALSPIVDTDEMAGAA